jgi:hypothetical protein
MISSGPIAVKNRLRLLCFDTVAEDREELW